MQLFHGEENVAKFTDLDRSCPLVLVFLVCVHIHDSCELLALDQVLRFVFVFAGCRRSDPVRNAHRCEACGHSYASAGWLRRHYGQYPAHDPGQYRLD